MQLLVGMGLSVTVLGVLKYLTHFLLYLWAIRSSHPLSYWLIRGKYIQDIAKHLIIESKEKYFLNRRTQDSFLCDKFVGWWDAKKNHHLICFIRWKCNFSLRSSVERIGKLTIQREHHNDLRIDDYTRWWLIISSADHIVSIVNCIGFLLQEAVTYLITTFWKGKQLLLHKKYVIIIINITGITIII